MKEDVQLGPRRPPFSPYDDPATKKFVQRLVGETPRLADVVGANNLAGISGFGQAARKALATEEFATKLRGISTLADKQKALGRQIDTALGAKVLQPEPIKVPRIPPNPMHEWMRELVSVSRQQTEQTRDLANSFSVAAKESAVRETRMFWITVASLGVTVISVIVAVVALAA